ncbi:MAG: nucleoside triphosphate pyrophosphohydrolase [Armatimonadota bacterium]
MNEKIKDEFSALVDTVRILRGPNGCPWDKEQTHDSLKKFAIEETYEVVDAIESGDPKLIEDELGDLMLQILLHAQIAEECGDFNIADVCKRLREKLQRRHPHVFSGIEVSGIDEIWKNWEAIKKSEPGYDERKSALDGVPNHLPALMKAAKISKKAAKTGFDWPNISSVMDKLREEMAELEEAIDSNDREHISNEIGDMLFTLVNIARFMDIDPEQSLRDMLERFRSRFQSIEKHAIENGKMINEMTIEEMDMVWDKCKQGK